MKVVKWGNCLAVRLPAAVVESLKLQDGDEIEIRVDGPYTLSVAKKPEIQEMLERVRKLRGVMPEDFKFDREDANER
ncbi:MAG: AbrB/MazE/SpoVT family DNA-binding domain-containing protein [Dokdonella sp.]